MNGPMRAARPAILALLAVLAASSRPSAACTNFLISKGASADGSTMITYAADSHELFGELYHWPAGRHAPGTMIPVYEWDTGSYLGEIAQAEQTWSVVGNMNEHQVAIGETTWGGRPELKDPKGIVDYGSLMYLALQRATTAREAIRVMTDLVAQYGYHSTGETFSISDPNEVWLLDMIGKGPGRKGAVWVARRVPDGYISGHANAPRIRQFPLNDPKDTLFAPDVISFARERGWFSGKDAEFSFADTYNPDRYGARRFCDARVWCMYRRAAPSHAIPSDWVKGDEKAEPLPLWIKPDRKLTVADVVGFMRDHFEGTEFDMTKDVGAGPHALPYRWRPMTWSVDGVDYLHERATSTQQTGFSFVAQSRGWLPNPIGGILWFGVDDTYSTVYFPMYCGSTGVPKSFAVGTGSFHDVTFDAAFWIFNQVSNFAYLRYDDMIRDIQRVQRELEGRFQGEIVEVDAAAAALFRQSPRLAKDYVTRYSIEAGDSVTARWRDLSKALLYKYLDGNVKDEHGEVTHPKYPEDWYRAIVADAGERVKARKLVGDLEEERVEKEKVRKTAEALSALLQARGIVLDDETQKKIAATDDLKTLEGWLVRAATASGPGDVFE